MDCSDCDKLKEGAALFTLLGRLIYGAPDGDLFAAAARDRLFDEIPFLKKNDCAAGRAELARWMDSCAEGGFADEDFEAIRVDYGRLFLGAQRVAAPLWESVWFSRERTVFQEQTYQVRSMYARYDLQVESFDHEPDDHLAYELLFIGHLLSLAAEKAMKDEEGARVVMRDAKSFALCHPGQWVPQWREVVLEKARTPFYRGYADLVATALERLVQWSPVSSASGVDD